MKNLDLLIPKDAPKGGTWAWAKIIVDIDSSEVEYVRVRLDGEDADLQAKPIFLCDPHEFWGAGGVGSPTGRSLVQLLDGQVYIYGQSGSMPRAELSEIIAGRYDSSPNGRALFALDNPSIQVADGSGGWFQFSPTQAGTTAWRTTITGWTGGPAAGQTFWNTDTDQLDVWDGSAWVAFERAPTDSGWINIPLAAGYEAAETGVPQYRIKAGVVYIRGSIQQSSTGTLALNTSPGHTIGTLPAGVRPVGADIITMVAPQNPASNQARMFVWTNGNLVVFLSGSAATSPYVSLDANFPI